MSADLAGIGVLVTRPTHQAEALCRAVEAAGARAVRFPVLAIAQVEEPEPARRRLARAAEYDLIVFVSPNAVTFARELLGGALPPVPRLAAVGKGTARELALRFGRQPDIVPAERFDSEGLLAADALQAVAGWSVLIVRGEGGREVLADTLRSRGARVEYAEVYRRVRPAGDARALMEAGARGEVDVAVVTSSEGLENLCALVDAAGGREWLRALPLILISERTAARARELGFRQRPLIAAGAGDAVLVEALVQWRRRASDERIDR